MLAASFSAFKILYIFFLPPKKISHNYFYYRTAAFIIVDDKGNDFFADFKH